MLTSQCPFLEEKKKKETLLPLERVTRKIRETEIFVLDVRAITLATRTARPNNLRRLLDDVYVLTLSLRDRTCLKVRVQHER